MSDTDTSVSNISAMRGHVQALAFARKGGAALSAMLTHIADTKAAERMGSLDAFLFLETHFTDDEQSSIPVPGSKKEDSGNKPYDKYTVEVRNTDGKKKVPGSWFTDVVKATAEWQASDHRIQWCKDTSFVTEDGQKCPADIMAMGDGARRDEVKRLRQRITDCRTGLVKGAMLWHHVNDIAELNPERIAIKMPFKAFKKLDANGEPMRGPNNEFIEEEKVTGSNIRLYDPAKEQEDKVFSVSEFLALKPEKIPADKEKTLVSLEETKARAPRTGGTGKGGAKTIAVPTTVEPLLNLLNIISTALDAETEAGQLLNTKLMAAAAAETDKADSTVEAIGDAAIALDNVWSTIDARYHSIKAKRAAAANAKAAAETQTRRAAAH